MPSANIEINAVAGSNDDLPIDTLVQLSNADTGGETTYLWEILDQPPGPADALSNPAIENPTFTPKKEGSYLLRLTVNAGPAQIQDTAIAAVRQVRTRLRVPAAGETLEVDGADGWATAADEVLREVDEIRADPLLAVAVAAAGLTVGDVARVTGTATVLSGLPGQFTAPEVDLALAIDAETASAAVFVVVEAVGGGAPGPGDLTVLRRMGLVLGLTGAPAVGDRVYVDDTGAISLAPGTLPRQIGFVVATHGGVTYDIFLDGASPGVGADPDPIFGTGALGTVVVGANDPAFDGLRDYEELTIDAGFTVSPAANKLLIIRARRRVTVEGSIDASGAIATGPDEFAVGATAGSGSGGGGGGGNAAVAAGANGVVGTVVAGATSISAAGTDGLGGAAGVAGAPGGGGGNGTAGTPGTLSANLEDQIRQLVGVQLVVGGLIAPAGSTGGVGGAGGDDGGGAAAGGAGGAGGTAGLGGGLVIIIAPDIVIGGAGQVLAKGTAGGNGANGTVGTAGTVPNGGGGGGGGGGSGGSGGAGGVVALFYRTVAITGTVSAAGGAAGTGGTGANGGAGAGGGSAGGKGGNGAAGAAGSAGLSIQQAL